LPSGAKLSEAICVRWPRSSRTSLNVAVSYRRTMPRLASAAVVPRPPQASSLPSGENTAEFPASWVTFSPVAASHSVVNSACVVVARSLPSGEKATRFTTAVSNHGGCPSLAAPASQRRSSLPVATSHSAAVWSQLPVAMTRPSGERATETSRSRCPCSTTAGLPVAASHR
jgi:hypothetical protein